MTMKALAEQYRGEAARLLNRLSEVRKEYKRRPSADTIRTMSILLRMYSENVSTYAHIMRYLAAVERRRKI